MNENEEKVLDHEEGQDNDLNLLNEIKQLKENTVPKEVYEKERSKNKELMKRIINGEGTEKEAEDTVDVKKLREELFGDDVEKLSNRDFWKKTLDLRHERLKEGVDIFLPRGSKTRYTREDQESANKVDEVISQMLIDSEENPALFDVLFREALN